MIHAIEERAPTIEEYSSLRNEVGWPPFSGTTIREGLSRSLYCVCVTEKNKLVGFGRIIGDNAIYYHIQDVMVSPVFQNTGIGTVIMKRLLAHIEKNAAANAHIGLMCSKGREGFYRKFGFQERPDEQHGAGMFRIIQ